MAENKQPKASTIRKKLQVKTAASYGQRYSYSKDAIHIFLPTA